MATKKASKTKVTKATPKTKSVTYWISKAQDEDCVDMWATKPRYVQPCATTELNIDDDNYFTTPSTESVAHICESRLLGRGRGAKLGRITLIVTDVKDA